MDCGMEWAGEGAYLDWGKPIGWNFRASLSAHTTPDEQAPHQEGTMRILSTLRQPWSFCRGYDPPASVVEQEAFNSLTLE